MHTDGDCAALPEGRCRLNLATKNAKHMRLICRFSKKIILFRRSLHFRSPPFGVSDCNARPIAASRKGTWVLFHTQTVQVAMLNRFIADIGETWMGLRSQAFDMKNVRLRR